jgi:hypothetical protein|tara:strand:- start:569 stop:1066 length:498 start_codon:yes stop_codon:yes gene_type:complete
MMTYEEAIHAFSYNPDTGELLWRNNYGTNAKVGNVAGYLDKNYQKLRFKTKSYLVHRVIWLIVNGQFPDNQIDHIDGNKLNNKIENLRDVDNETNGRNRSMNKNNTSGMTGVTLDKRSGKWKASIIFKGNRMYLGYFGDFELACLVRKEAEHKYGFHINHGRKAA